MLGEEFLTSLGFSDADLAAARALQARIEQMSRDIEREGTLNADAGETIARLEAEAEDLARRGDTAALMKRVSPGVSGMATGLLLLIMGAQLGRQEDQERLEKALAAMQFDQRLAAMPRDALWVRDVTLSHTTWGNRIFPVYGPRDSVYPVGAAIAVQVDPEGGRLYKGDF